MLMMMRSDSSYTPTEGCTAEELLKCLTADDYDACIATCSNEEGDQEEEDSNGLATISGKAESTQEIPYNAVNVKVGTITLKAGDYDTKVSSVEISRDGLGNFAANQLQLALRGANIETAYASVSTTTNTAKVKFSPALVLKAGKSETFDVVVQLPGNTEANATHNFTVTNVVVSNGTSKGYPVKLGTIKTTSAATKTVNVTLSNGDTPIKAGDTEKLLAKLDIDFNRAAGTLSRLTLLNVQTPTEKLGDAFDNIVAYVDGKKVGDVSWTDDKIIVSDLNISKEREDTLTIEIKADPIYSKLTANFKFQLDSIDVSEGNYGMSTVPALNTPIVQTAPIVVNGNNIVFKKVNLAEKNVLPGTKNIIVFDSTFKAATDTTIKTITVTPTTVTGLPTVLSADSAKLIVNGEEFPITDTKITTATAFDIDTNVDIDANKTAKIQIVLGTKVPTTATTATTKYAVKIKTAVSTENVSTVYTVANTVNSDTLTIDEGKATLATATVSAPVTRSLFSNKNQEVGRFSVKADSDKVTLKDLTLKLATNLPAADDITTLLDGNLTLVDVATDNVINATIEFDTANDATNKTILVKDMDYAIEKDETANIKLMADLSKIDTAYIGKTLKFTITALKVNTSIRNSVASTPSQALSDKDYTLRITAPTIAMEKVSDNQFKVVIKNVDEDNAITIAKLQYTVKAKSDAADFYAGTKVCLTEDINTTTCGTAGTAFGSLATDLNTTADLVDLSKNEEKIFYILVEGKYIEPDVLKATISSLSYVQKQATHNIGNIATSDAENYNVVTQ